MARVSVIAVMFVSLISLTNGCGKMQSKIDLEKEKPIVEQVIKNTINWAMNKDKDLLFRSVVNDSTFFIFHPDNAGTIKGFDAFAKFVEQVFMNPGFKAVSSAFKEMRIDFSRSGETAWFSCFLDDSSEWNGRPSAWVNVRWTGVLEKRDGNWVMMQMHFSHSVEDMQAAIKKALESKQP
jgi:SnoaL-like domain